MTFAAFERRARALFESIPEELRGGVEYLVVERAAMLHPELEEVYTLGECATGELELGDDLAAPTRSGIHLYWGSFRALAEDDDAFDWEGELWETLTHEIRHHRESGAGEDALEDFDYAADENYKRRAGEPFDPLFFRGGEEAGGGWLEVEGDRFLELSLEDEARPLSVDWEGGSVRLGPPFPGAEVSFLFLTGEDAEQEAAVVLVRPPPRWWRRLRDLLHARAPSVHVGRVGGAGHAH